MNNYFVYFRLKIQMRYNAKNNNDMISLSGQTYVKVMKTIYFPM